MNFLLVFVGGGIGSVARYAMMKAIGRVISTDFPWHTLGVNLLGALLIGAVAQFFALRVSGVETARLLLVTGFLGGFTTFSAFSLEGALMWKQGDNMMLAAYVSASVIGTIIAVLCGQAVMRVVL
ncbi:MAG: fluoride efflux transporter CrcB [Alphaproteobacteria bacterium]